MKDKDSQLLSGRAWKFKDNVDTDLIIPARYLNTSDPIELAKHCMEDADPNWVNKAQKGDFIVAGENFGCGSSREHAPVAIKAAGISAVIAKSFARIFYRNAINIGLPILESPEAVDSIAEGNEIGVELTTGTINNITKGKSFKTQPFPEFMQKIIDKGGLINYLKSKVS